jgi:hypothetical protein
VLPDSREIKRRSDRFVGLFDVPAAAKVPPFEKTSA